MEETEDNQPDYIEKLGWKKGIGNDEKDDAIPIDQQEVADKKVHFAEKVDVVELSAAK